MLVSQNRYAVVLVDPNTGFPTVGAITRQLLTRRGSELRDQLHHFSGLWIRRSQKAPEMAQYTEGR